MKKYLLYVLISVFSITPNFLFAQDIDKLDDTPIETNSITASFGTMSDRILVHQSENLLFSSYTNPVWQESYCGQGLFNVYGIVDSSTSTDWYRNLSESSSQLFNATIGYGEPALDSYLTVPDLPLIIDLNKYAPYKQFFFLVYCQDFDSNILDMSYGVVTNSSYSIDSSLLKGINLGLSVIIVLGFLMVVGFIWNNLTKKKPWH